MAESGRWRRVPRSSVARGAKSRASSAPWVRAALARVDAAPEYLLPIVHRELAAPHQRTTGRERREAHDREGEEHGGYSAPAV